MLKLHTKYFFNKYNFIEKLKSYIKDGCSCSGAGRSHVATRSGSEIYKCQHSVDFGDFFDSKGTHFMCCVPPESLNLFFQPTLKIPLILRIHSGLSV